MLPYRVNNIKISFKIDGQNVKKTLQLVAVSNPYVTKIDGNFFVLRKRFVYIIFFTGHVNCTKLTSLSEVKTSQNVLLEVIDQEKIAEDELYLTSSPTVDNICSSGEFAKRIRLLQFATFLHRENVRHRYNPQTFPGLNLKLCGISITVFTSGKFIAVGAKTQEDLVAGIKAFHERLMIFERNE